MSARAAQGRPGVQRMRSAEWTPWFIWHRGRWLQVFSTDHKARPPARPRRLSSMRQLNILARLIRPVSLFDYSNTRLRAITVRSGGDIAPQMNENLTSSAR